MERLADAVRTGGDDLVEQPGVERAGRDRVDVDAIVAQLQGKGLDESNDRRLRRRVGGQAGQRRGGAAAGQLDDLSVADSTQLRYQRPR